MQYVSEEREECIDPRDDKRTIEQTRCKYARDDDDGGGGGGDSLFLS
jgi:hypothetical protein